MVRVRPVLIDIYMYIAAAPAAGDQRKAPDGSNEGQPAFCHAFDLMKRLTHPSLSTMTFIPVAPSRESPYASIHQRLQSAISSSPPNTVHRIVIPSLLNPTLYPPEASQPEHLLQFLHTLKSLTTAYPNRLTAMLTLPLSLHPRTTGLIRWAEILSDGVIELCPFSHSSDALASSGAATSHEEPPQGILKVHRLPVLHERGGGNAESVGQDWAFTLSRKRFEIKPFSLPPEAGDKEAQDAAAGAPGGMPKKEDLEF